MLGKTLPPRPSLSLLREVAQRLLPKEEHREHNYGLLDLGRQVCTYVGPKCGECPLASDCDFYNVRSKAETPEMGEGIKAPPPSKLRAIRHDQRLSLKRLAEIAEVSKLTVIRIETGRTSPRRETLEKLGRALQVSPDELSG